MDDLAENGVGVSASFQFYVMNLLSGAAGLVDIVRISSFHGGSF